MGEPRCLAGQLVQPELKSRRKWERGGMHMSDGALAAEGSGLYSTGQWAARKMAGNATALLVCWRKPQATATAGWGAGGQVTVCREDWRSTPWRQGMCAPSADRFESLLCARHGIAVPGSEDMKGRARPLPPEELAGQLEGRIHCRRNGKTGVIEGTRRHVGWKAS